MAHGVAGEPAPGEHDAGTLDAGRRRWIGPLAGGADRRGRQDDQGESQQCNANPIQTMSGHEQFAYGLERILDGLQLRIDTLHAA